MLNKLRLANTNGFHICVGLDADINKIPVHLKSEMDPIFEFNKAIIDSTMDFSAAYKFNLAFYEAGGIKGLESMIKSIDYIGLNRFKIGDGKRADIGNSSNLYAKAFFESYRFDSITVAPYMGTDSIQPFLNYKDKLTYILGLTSNEGASTLQMLKTDSGSFIFEEVLKMCSGLNKNGNTGVVFGATHKLLLEEKIASLAEFDVLLPGLGAQGATIEDVVPVFYSNNHNKFLINFSRSLIYCDQSKDYHKSVQKEIKSLHESIKNSIK